MTAVVISVGSELVSGQELDTNAQWLADRLTGIGIEVVGHVTVGDDVSSISASIQKAGEAANCVIVTGGLGPTPDDRTRAALASAVGVALHEDPDALESMNRFFARWQRTVDESNRVQALVPLGARAIPNVRGTAPGIVYEQAGTIVFALPGVPAEMCAMFDADVVPRLKPMTAGVGSRCQAMLRCFGITESRLGERLSEMMARGRNPAVGTTASDAVLTVRITAREGGGAARELVDRDIAEIRHRLGSCVFGEGNATLQSVATELLQKRGQTIAVAESCTGGLLSKMLTDTPGSSRCFRRGYVVYSNHAKTELVGVAAELLDRHGAVSEEVANSLAVGCRDRARTDWAIGITGIAGPGGGDPLDKPVGLVHIALAAADGVDVRRARFGEHLTRSEIRDRSCKTALNMLRLRLLADEAKNVSGMPV